MMWLLALVLLAVGCAPEHNSVRDPHRFAFPTDPGQPGAPQVAMAGTWNGYPNPTTAIAWVGPDGWASIAVGGLLFYRTGNPVDGAGQFQARYIGQFTDTTLTADLTWTDLPSSAGVAQGSLTAHWSNHDSIPDLVYADSFARGQQVLRVTASLRNAGGAWVPQTVVMPNLPMVREVAP